MCLQTTLFTQNITLFTHNIKEIIYNKFWIWFIVITASEDQMLDLGEYQIFDPHFIESWVWSNVGFHAFLSDIKLKRVI